MAWTKFSKAEIAELNSRLCGNANCGKVLNRRPVGESLRLFSTRKFCSRDCGAVCRAPRPKRRPTIGPICAREGCGKNLSRRQAESFVKFSERKYCSSQCGIGAGYRRKKSEACKTCGSNDWIQLKKGYGRNIPQRQCRTCKNQRNAKHYHVYKIVKNQRRREDPRYQRMRKAAEIKKYGLTYTQFEMMKTRQNNRCRSCGNPEPLGTELSIDHCHKTNRVRGLLCRACNLGLGYFKHDPKKLAAAMAYMVVYNASHNTPTPP